MNRSSMGTTAVDDIAAADHLRGEGGFPTSVRPASGPGHSVSAGIRANFVEEGRDPSGGFRARTGFPPRRRATKTGRSARDALSRS